ncbi:MAG: signal peptidase I [Bdellovibrionales bacterium]
MQKLKGFFLFIILIYMAYFLRVSFYESYRIPTSHMLPTLFPGDYVFVNKFSYGLQLPFLGKIGARNLPEWGDIVVFEHPENSDQMMISRIVGLPGQEVRFENTYLALENILASRPGIASAKDIKGLKAKDFPKGLERYHTKVDFYDSVEFHTLNQTELSLYNSDTVQIPEGKLFVLGDYREIANDTRKIGLVDLESLVGRVDMIWFSCKKSLASIASFCDPFTIDWWRFPKKVDSYEPILKKTQSEHN